MQLQFDADCSDPQKLDSIESQCEVFYRDSGSGMLKRTSCYYELSVGLLKNVNTEEKISNYLVL